MPPICDCYASFAALIRRCTSVTTLEKACQLHALLLTTNTFSPKSPYVNNNLVSMYVRCGSMDAALSVFDRMSQRNVVSYNALIAACSRQHADTLAFDLLSLMGVDGLRPNELTFISLIQACSLLKDRSVGSMLHAHVMKFGFLYDTCVQTSLLGMYSNCGDHHCAGKVFMYMVDKDAVAWNSVIFGSLKNDRIDKALHIFRDMLSSGVSPTQFTYSMIFNVCAKLERYACGRLLHAQAVVSGNPADLPMQNALLNMYFNCGDANTACSIFCRMQNPDIVSWNSMISGLAENGHGEMALELFIQLKRLSFAKPDEYTLAAAVLASSIFSVNDCGKALHGDVIKAGFQSSCYIGSVLLSMYFASGENESAQSIFDLLPVKDVVIWTEMITAYSRMADLDTATTFFYGMYKEGHKTDSFALSGVLSACADLTLLKQGEMIHSLAEKTGHAIDMAVSGSLIDMYVKNGDLQGAESIFTKVLDPDLKCFNVMLGGYAYHGLAVNAFVLFDKILTCGLIPDQVTFLSALSACNHSCLVDEGKFLWYNMKEFGIRPGPKHYSCMVSLLSRAGLLNEAEEMIILSPLYEDRLELWRTLLSSCVKNHNLVMGIRAAEHILSLDAEDTATHIMLSNLYAAAGEWDNVADIRRKIRGLMLDKDPGLSWIGAQDKLNVFSSGGQSHPNISEIQLELDMLMGNMIKSEADEFDTMLLAA